MRKYKMNGIDIVMRVNNYQGVYEFRIGFYDGGSGKEVESIKLSLPAVICKSQFNDSNLVRHILNFFIKDS